MTRFWDLLSQFYPPKPKFTELNVPDLQGKVYIVTGSNTGIGREVAQILYSKNAKVYVAARSEEKARQAIQAIKKGFPKSAGELIFLHLDLADLTTIKASVEEFLSKETKLHVLFNNAGVWAQLKGSPKTVQGHPLEIGVNNIGTFMFTKLLTPLLVASAKTEPSNTVRVVWVSSVGAELESPKPGGIPLDNLDFHDDKGGIFRYNVSKAGNYLQATEFAKRHKSDGVVSVALNPGNLASDLARDLSSFVRFLLRCFVAYPPINGAYTELFAAFSPEITVDKIGAWIIPFGRVKNIREDLLAATKTESEGGSEIGLKFWEWNEEQIKEHIKV